METEQYILTTGLNLTIIQQGMNVSISPPAVQAAYQCADLSLYPILNNQRKCALPVYCYIGGWPKNLLGKSRIVGINGML